MNDQQITSLDCAVSHIGEELKEDLQDIREDLNKLPKCFISYSLLDSVLNGVSFNEGYLKDIYSRTKSKWVDSNPRKIALYLKGTVLRERGLEVGHIPPSLRMLFYYLRQLRQENQDLIEKVSARLELIEISETNNANVELCCSEAALPVFSSVLIEEGHYKAEKFQLEGIYQKLLKFQRKLIWLNTITIPLLVAWSYVEFAVKNSLAFWKNLTRFSDRMLLLIGYSLTAFLGQCLSPFDKSWTSDLNGLHRQMIEQGKPSWVVLLLMPLHFAGILFGGLQIALDELLNSEEDLLVHAV